MRFAAVLHALLSAAPLHAKDDSALAVADAFEQAIAAGDEGRVKAVLAPDVLIYEMGGREASFAEYAAGHLKADIEFMKAMRREVLDRAHGTSGDLAWVATRRRITGPYHDKPVDISSTETLVLKRQAGTWKIVHVQWSSQQTKPKP
jgi:ketosteroid isomerase-like protein